MTVGWIPGGQVARPFQDPRWLEAVRIILNDLRCASVHYCVFSPNVNPKYTTTIVEHIYTKTKKVGSEHDRWLGARWLEAVRIRMSRLPVWLNSSTAKHQTRKIKRNIKKYNNVAEILSFIKCFMFWQLTVEVYHTVTKFHTITHTLLRTFISVISGSVHKSLL